MHREFSEKEFSGKNYCAAILGGSSGFGLATAVELATRGMDICIVHRDRRGAMQRIEESFELVRKTGVAFRSFNLDALSSEGRGTVINELEEHVGRGRVRVLLHSIAFGSLKLIAPQAQRIPHSVGALAESLGRNPEEVQKAVDSLFTQGASPLHTLATPAAYNSDLLLQEDEMLQTIGAMGTSLLSWTAELFKRKLFLPRRPSRGSYKRG